MQGSKIRLSPSEEALICNAGVILTKNSIIQKTVALLTEIQDQLSAENTSWQSLSTPKISKGENYQGLPYVVLDYPRISNGEDLFFIRTMFWWGRFFSSTLQLSGSYQKNSLPCILSVYNTLAQENYYVGISQDAWQHHFESSNYRKIATCSRVEFNNLLQQMPHTKIAARWSLSDWDTAANHLIKSWKMLAGLIS